MWEVGPQTSFCTLVIRKNEAPLKGVSRVKNSEKQFDSRQYSPSHLGTSGFRPNNLGAGSGGFPQTNRVDSGPKQFLPEHSAFSSFNSGFGNNFLNNSLGATIPPHQQNIRSETNPLANGVANFNGNIQSNFDRFGTSNINANGVVNTDLGRNNFNQNFGEISPTVIRKFFTDSPPQISQFPAKSSQQFPINSAVNSAQFVSGSNQLSQFGLNDFRQQQNSQSKDICTPVECNFESDMCEWFNDFKSTTEWKLRNPSTPGFGIPTDQTGSKKK